MRRWVALVVGCLVSLMALGSGSLPAYSSVSGHKHVSKQVHKKRVAKTTAAEREVARARPWWYVEKNLPPPKVTPAEVNHSRTVDAAISWHLNQADVLFKQRQVDEASNEWMEVLRLNPDNASAQSGLKQVEVAQAKEAFLKFASANNVTAIADVLEEDTCDINAQRLFKALRTAIQGVDAGAATSPDPSIYDDFENFINKFSLGAIIVELERGRYAYRYAGRPYGRDLVSALVPWIVRAQRCGACVEVAPPFRTAGVAQSIQTCRFTWVGAGHVNVDDVRDGPGFPLQITRVDQNWRVGPPRPFRLLYVFKPVVKHDVRVR